MQKKDLVLSAKRYQGQQVVLWTTNCDDHMDQYSNCRYAGNVGQHSNCMWITLC